MAVSQGSVPSAPLGTIIIEDADANNTKEAVATTAGAIHSVYINNTHNAQVYVKLYELTAANTTVGTHHPSFVFSCPASTSRQYNFPDELPWATALTMACTTTAGTGGTTNPGATVLVRLTIE
jgi:hypothetical protein